MTNPSAHQLTKWSRLIRLRDQGICLVCGGKFPVWRLQAHHIRPKALYPDRALQLSNGVTLCAGCHLGAVHRQNTFRDIDPENDYPGWRVFLPMFERWVKLAAQRRFQAENQSRLAS